MAKRAAKTVEDTQIEEPAEKLPAVPEEGLVPVTPAEKDALINAIIKAAAHKTALERQLAAANEARSEAVKNLYLSCGKKVFKIDGRLCTIEKRKDTFFLKEMGVELDDTVQP